MILSYWYKIGMILNAPTNWNNNLISGINQCFCVEYLSAILLWQFKEETDTAINTGDHCIWQLQGIVRTIIHGTTMDFKYIHGVTKVIMYCLTKLSSFMENFMWILSIPLVLKLKNIRKTRSIPKLWMPWQLRVPGHPQPWYFVTLWNEWYLCVLFD